MSTTATDAPVTPPSPESDVKLPYWVAGDTNAFFGLGFNILVNVLVLTGLMIGVVQLPAGDVFGTILPALGIALVLGNVFYSYLGRRLARQEGRTDVAAMPYGPSVPHMFIVVFVIMLPIFLATKDPVRAWEAGIAWAFVIGVIVLIGAFVGPYIRKYTPRAAMLGTLAGISITFISMRPAAQMWEAAWIGLPVLALILIGFLAGVRLPGNFPMGLAALLVGTAIAWIGGYMNAPDVTAGVKEIAFALPSLQLDHLINGLKDVSPLLATAIPLGVYNFTEAMTNVESAAAAGDSYNLRAVLLADGTGAIVGSALGSPFPPAVYIGHPGWKDAGGSHRLLDGQRRGGRADVLLRAVRAAQRAAADSRDRAHPAVHRLHDRCPGVPGVAEGARRGDHRGADPEHRAVGHRPDGQRARRGRHLGRAGRGGQDRRCRGHLFRPENSW
jgi:adenine/guanine/hypoxanthine permease